MVVTVEFLVEVVEFCRVFDIRSSPFSYFLLYVTMSESSSDEEAKSSSVETVCNVHRLFSTSYLPVLSCFAIIRTY